MKKSDDVKTESFVFRLSKKQKRMLISLGGADWIRKIIIPRQNKAEKSTPIFTVPMSDANYELWNLNISRLPVSGYLEFSFDYPRMSFRITDSILRDIVQSTKKG